MPILEAEGLVKTWQPSSRRWRRLCGRARRDRRALGPNGAGKTTSFRMTCGMIEPDAGSVDAQRHRCHQLAHVSPRQRRRHGLSGPGIERLSQALGARRTCWA